MQLNPGTLDRPIIRLPLPGYAKWAVRIWVTLFLLSPLLVFFRLSVIQFLILAAILGGFVLPFLLGRLPGELEAASDRVILLNPRAHRYAWLYLLGRDNQITNPRPKTFPVAETSLQWEEQRLSLNHGDGSVLLGHGAQMEPVMHWLLRRGVQSGRARVPRIPAE
ncbi:MAG: hypothetical protein P4L36_08290 [Holophaga sp.]|nr:hypothetical protein [Holophaga sp.]